MARKKIIAGNWKMNMTPSQAVELINTLKPLVANDEVDVLLCVPAIDIIPAMEAAKGSNIMIGAENMYFEEKGAFTGATEARMGKFQLAGDGDILLDEIGDMDLQMQSKLLRVLESREFERVGGREIIPLRAGIIASTNQNLLAMSERRAFRADLYYRLSTIELYLPPLRARPEDIPLLIDRLCAQKGGRLRLTSQAMEYLQRYTWPGNVRQLKNLVGRWLVFYDGVQITGRHVVDELTIGQRSYNEAFGVTDPLAGTASPSGPASAPPPTLADQERAALEQALAYAGGNRALAARVLGISRTALYQKLERFRLS